MSLREELQNRADQLDAELLALSGRIRALERESDDVHTCINALDIAEMDAQDAALEPAPAEPEAEPVAPDVEIPEGFTKWEGGECPVPFGTEVNVVWRLDNGACVLKEFVIDSFWGEPRIWGGKCEPEDDPPEHAKIIAYRIISQPADQSEEESDRLQAAREGGKLRYQMGLPYPEGDHSETIEITAAVREGWTAAQIDHTYGELHESETETHTDDLRTAEGEAVAGDDRIETQSITSDPDFVAAVERAEAKLAIDAQTCEPIYPHPQPAYVGLQDPELDADWDAMKAREEKPKPLTDTWHHKFGIFGKREEV